MPKMSRISAVHSCPYLFICTRHARAGDSRGVERGVEGTRLHEAGMDRADCVRRRGSGAAVCAVMTPASDTNCSGE